MNRETFIKFISEKRKDFLSNLSNARDESIANFIRGQLSGLKHAEEYILSCSNMKAVAEMLAAQRN